MSRKKNSGEALQIATRKFIAARDNRDTKELKAEIAKSDYEKAQKNFNLELAAAERNARDLVFKAGINILTNTIKQYIAELSFRFYENPMTPLSTSMASLLWGSVVCEFSSDQSVKNYNEKFGIIGVEFIVGEIRHRLRAHAATTEPPWIDPVEFPVEVLTMVQEKLNKDSDVTDISYVQLERYQDDTIRLFLTPHKP